MKIEGYVIANTFQINLEYQHGIDNSRVDLFNNYGEGTVHNWTDEEYYHVTISQEGGLPVWSYSDLAEDIDADLQWTVTGWGQTLFGGTIEEGRLVVTTNYRPFDMGGYANGTCDCTGTVEDECDVLCSGSILIEPVAFTFSGEIGPGTQLTVENRTDDCD